jgi:Flp pilus assembly protein TadG
MAVVLPILLLLLAAVVDAGRAFDAYIVLTNAVREGARYGTIIDPAPTEAAVKNVVVEDVLGSGTNVTHMADFTASNVTVVMGTTAVTVTASYNFDLWFGGIIGVPTYPLRKQSAMPMFLED